MASYWSLPRPFFTLRRSVFINPLVVETCRTFILRRCSPPLLLLLHLLLGRGGGTACLGICTSANYGSMRTCEAELGSPFFLFAGGKKLISSRLRNLKDLKPTPFFSLSKGPFFLSFLERKFCLPAFQAAFQSGFIVSQQHSGGLGSPRAPVLVPAVAAVSGGGRWRRRRQEERFENGILGQETVLRCGRCVWTRRVNNETKMEKLK